MCGKQGVSLQTNVHPHATSAPKVTPQRAKETCLP